MGNDDEIKDGSTGPRKRTPRNAKNPDQTPKSGEHGSEQVEDSHELAVRSRNMFLRDVTQQLARRELYNLDDEFAKTRKNRSPIVPVAVGLFVVIMVAVAIVITTYIQQRSQNVPVNISAFQDVNLMELLDRAKQISDQLTTANRDLQTLESNEAAEISDVRAAEQHQIQLVDNEMISDAEKKTKTAAIRNQAQAKINQIQAKYADSIKKKKAEVANLQNEAAKYDTRQVQQAKKQEAILNNQQKLFDMQMKKTEDFYNKKITDLTNQYKTQIAAINQHNQQLVDLMKKNQATEIANLTAKYNPTFTDPNLLALLQEPIPSDPISGVTEDQFVKIAIQAGTVSPSSVNDLETRINNFATLLGALQKVPYQNSVPPTLSHLDYFNNRIITDYRSIGSGMTKIVNAKDKQIQQLQTSLSAANQVIGEYDHALSALARNSRENGYILDPRKTSRIAVFVDPLYRVQKGDIAYVFRRDDQQIGTIRFTDVSGGTYTAEEVSLAKAKVPMQPFDKILVNLK